MKIISKLLLSGFLIILTGCYDLVNQPLGGLGGEKAIFSIAGNWIEKSKNHSLEILETDEEDEFTFTYDENGKIWKGLVEAAYYEKKVVLSLDLASLTLNGDKLIQPSETMYLLIGLYFRDDKLYLIPADMQNFKKIMAEHFFAAPIKEARSCVGNNEICKQHFSNGYLLSPSKSKKFDEKLQKSFRRVFPSDQATILESSEAP